MVSEKLQKRLYSNVSCDVEFYRVLKLSKINLDRTGALRFTLFWGGFSGRPPAGPPGRGARLGPARKVPQMSHETLAWPLEIDFEKF